MSGGYFDHRDYQLREFADILKSDIVINRYGYTQETIMKLIECHSFLILLSKRLHRVDWMLSCDDGEDNFNEYWNEDAAIAEQESLTIDRLDRARESLYGDKRKELERLLPEMEKKLMACPNFPPLPPAEDGRFRYDRTAHFAETVDEAKSHLVESFDDISIALARIVHILESLENFKQGYYF